MEGTHEADEDADAYWGPRFITQPHGYAEVERAQADLNARYRRQTGTGPHTPLSPSPRDRNIFEVNNPERRSVQSFSSPHGNGSPVTALQTLVNLKKQSFSLAPMEGSTSSEVKLSFVCDSLVPCTVKLYWAAKEIYSRDTNGRGFALDFARANGRPADSTSSVGHVSIPVPVGMASPFSFTFKPSTYFSPEEIDALVVKDPHQGVPTSPTIPPPTPVPAEASPRTPSNRRQSWRWLRWRQPQSDNEGENEGSGVELTPSHGVDTPNPSPNEPSHPQLTFIPLVVVLSTAQKNSQVNYVDITIGKDGHWVGKIARQKAVINDRVFVLQEVFGFSDGETAPADQQNFQTSSTSLPPYRECIACLSSPRDTMVLPCRHLCMCSDCAEHLQKQGRDDAVQRQQPWRRPGPPACPICREVFHSLVVFHLPQGKVQQPAQSARMKSLQDLGQFA